VRHVDAPKTRAAFHNTGLYNLGGTGAVPDAGLAVFTHRARDTGAFRAPSLRNVAVTAPYMHDGSIATLGEVIDFYARGGRLTDSGPLAGDGKNSRYKRPEIHGFTLSETDRADLIAFLRSLTERSLLGAPTPSNASDSSLSSPVPSGTPSQFR
jgi:cytochrome c peroxidase